MKVAVINFSDNVGKSRGGARYPAKCIFAG